MLPKTKIITNDETLSLISAYKKTKNIETRNSIILGNIGMIYALAHKFSASASHQTFDDFVGEGVIGMIDAIDKFDPSINKTFSTYAHWNVLKRVNAAVSTGGITQYRINIYRAYAKEKNKLINAGIEPTLEVISAAINVPLRVLSDIITYKDNVVSGNTATYQSITTENDIVDSIDYSNIMDIASSILTKNEITVIKHRFGLDGNDELTLKQIAEKLNVSAEWVRLVQDSSIKKIKSFIRKKTLIDANRKNIQ